MEAVVLQALSPGYPVIASASRLTPELIAGIN
jgi:hypothetical protein